MKKKGLSYQKRVIEIQRIYDHYAALGLSNREIWRRHIWPRYGICERQYNNIINAQVEEAAPALSALLHNHSRQLTLWQDLT